MKKTYFILILTITINCSPKKFDHRITTFENTLGEKETMALNNLVFDFEKNLEKMYVGIALEKAYQKYLIDFISNSVTDQEKFMFQSDKTKKEFHQSGLWNEIYRLDSTRGLTVYQEGKYMKSLHSIKDSNTLINDY